MPKTINVRIENNIFDIIQKAARRKNKTVAGYIKFAALTYTVKEIAVENEDDKEYDSESDGTA